MFEITIVLGVISLVLSIFIALISYSLCGIYKNIVRGWCYITASFLVLVGIRIFSLLSDLYPSSSYYSLVRLLVQVFSVVFYALLFWGLLNMKTSLEQNRKIEEETMREIEAFEKRRRLHLKQKRQK